MNDINDINDILELFIRYTNASEDVKQKIQDIIDTEEIESHPASSEVSF